MTAADPLASLGVVPRILLATDGTLTHILEAYAAEPVHLVKLSHDPVTDPTVRSGLGLDAGERSRRRVILLRGTKSDATFVHAESFVHLDRLPAAVARGLEETDTPIGKLLFSCRTETLREMITTGEERDAAIADHFGLDGAAPLATRTYQIVFEGRTVARITETFPQASWPDTPEAAPVGSAAAHAAKEGPGVDASGGAVVDVSDLGAVPRILFATDGAVTHIVEAHAGEPVDRVLLASAMADEDLERRLGVSAGERTIRRRSVLRGRHSGRAFVHGSSVVLPDRLPEPVVAGAVGTDRMLLDLLSEHRIGSFRETIAEWEGTDDEVAAAFDVEPSTPLVARTYKIVVGGRPVAWVHEAFPRNGFLAAPAPGSAA